MFSAIKNIKIQCGIEGKLMKKCKEDAVMQTIPRFSLGLRKFRYDCESKNFAILGKLRIFARLAKFR